MFTFVQGKYVIMASALLRQEVLKSFKILHKTSSAVFKNDKPILERARQEINDSYKKNKHVTDVDSIKELIKFANEVTHELKTTIAELEEVAPGRFRLNLRPEIFEEGDKGCCEKITKETK